MEWKKFSYSKKGFLIGLLIGILLTSISLFGIFFLNWDPTGATSVSKGFFSNTFFIVLWPIELLLFFIAISLYFRIIPTDALKPENDILFSSIIWIISAIIVSLLFAFIGLLIGWIIGKIKTKK